jgi:hypothetical protein
MRWHIGSLVALGLFAVAGQAQELHTPSQPAAPAVTVSGPVTHANLSIFLLHGKDTVASERKLLTMQEALEQKKLVVHETSAVNQLSVENVSDDVDIFIQNCDIVKGGKQDRMMAMDMLLSPRSGKVPIGSFCCEHGRWQQRGSESAAQFESSAASAGNNALKTAVNSARDQQKVWEEVDKAQKQLSANSGALVTKNASPTSYQLAIESKAVQEKIDEYVKALAKAMEGKNDVVGVAIAVNGSLRSVDVYGSHALMVKLWDKLLKGAAIDALSELNKDKKFTAAESKDVEALLTQAEKGKWSDHKPANRTANQAPAAEQAKDEATLFRTHILRCDSEKILLLETQDSLSKNQMLHRCYLVK